MPTTTIFNRYDGRSYVLRPIQPEDLLRTLRNDTDGDDDFVLRATFITNMGGELRVYADGIDDTRIVFVPDIPGRGGALGMRTAEYAARHRFTGDLAPGTHLRTALEIATRIVGVGIDEECSASVWDEESETGEPFPNFRPNDFNG